MLYKVLNLDGTPCHGGVGAWPLPTQRADGWEPGEWREVTGELVPCENGLHLCANERQLLKWLGSAIFEAEYDGEGLDGDDKVVVRRARLLRKVDTWDERSARSFAADCAERVLALLERELPGDGRASAAIETARRFAVGEASRDELAAAWNAAWAASWDVAWDADGIVARDAAGSAARDAAKAAAKAAAMDAWDAAMDASWYAVLASWYAGGDAARDAERDWQTERLRQYLIGEVTR